MDKRWAYAVYKLGMDYGSPPELRAIYDDLGLAVTAPDVWSVKPFPMNAHPELQNSEWIKECQRVNQIMSVAKEMRLDLISAIAARESR